MLLQPDCDKAHGHYEYVVNDNAMCHACQAGDRASPDGDESPPCFTMYGNFGWLGTESNTFVIPDVSDNGIESSLGYIHPFDSIEIGFLNDAIEMERQGNLRGSLATIYRRVDELMREAMLDALDEEITSVPAEKIGTDVLIGLLTATLPAKRKLPSRPQLFRSTLQLLKARGHFEPGILDGLE